MLQFSVIFCVSVLNFVESARILGVFPVPSLSHQVVFRALTTELAKRGHELVIVTPNPALPKDRPPDNITEIDVSFAYERLGKLIKEKSYIYKRGNIITADRQSDPATYKPFVTLIAEMMESPDVKKITEDKSQHYDLIIVETFFDYQLIVSEMFDAPMIIVSSFQGLHPAYESVGAIIAHPTLYPSVFGDFFGDLSLIDKLIKTKFEIDYHNAIKVIENTENELLKQYHGSKAPTVADLRKNVDMLFINSNPIFCDNKPLPPNAVYVGPLHLKPRKELPQEMKNYLDASKTGVIYVSLGTNVNTAHFDKEFINSFVEVFKLLPYDILWKYHGSIDNLPRNVRIENWFPQRDLLVHPNLKLFVTQGGMQSTDEAIDAEVPMVGIPILADQFYNVHKYVQLGIGAKVDAMTFDKNSLLEGIKTVLNDNSTFKENIKKLKQVLNDNPQTAKERAIWWTEYVIRHKGAKHLKTPAANVTWSEYLMVDVVAVIVSLAFIVLLVVVLVLKCLMAKIRSIKVKTN